MFGGDQLFALATTIFWWSKSAHHRRVGTLRFHDIASEAGVQGR